MQSLKNPKPSQQNVATVRDPNESTFDDGFNQFNKFAGEAAPPESRTRFVNSGPRSEAPEYNVDISGKGESRDGVQTPKINNRPESSQFQAKINENDKMIAAMLAKLKGGPTML